MKEQRFPFLTRLVAPALVMVVLFFLFHTFFLRRSLSRVRHTLQEISETDRFFELEKNSLLFQDLFLNNLSQRSGESGVGDSEFFAENQGNLNLPFQPGSKTELLLDTLLAAHEKNQSGLEKFWSDVHQQLLNFFLNVKQLIGQLESGRLGRGINELDEFQLEVIKQARAKELEGELTEAQKIYERFVEHYPAHSRVDIIKVSLASVYLRLGEYQEAGDILSKVRLSLASYEQVRLVSLLKQKIKELPAVSEKQQALEKQIRELEQDTGASVSDKLVELYFELGVTALQLYNLESSEKAFEKVTKLAPLSDEGKKADSILKWIRLLQEHPEESRKLMGELLRRLPQPTS